MLGATRTTEGGSGSKQSPRRLRRVRRPRRPLPATVGQGEGKLQNAPRPRVDHAQVNPSGVRAACRTISRRMLVQRRVSVKEPYPPRIPHHRHGRGPAMGSRLHGNDGRRRRTHHRHSRDGRPLHNRLSRAGGNPGLGFPARNARHLRHAVSHRGELRKGLRTRQSIPDRVRHHDSGRSPSLWRYQSGGESGLAASGLAVNRSRSVTGQVRLAAVFR